MIAKPPTTVRETLELLRFYRKEVGLAPIFQAMADDSWTPRQMFYAVHGRRPDSLAAVLNEKDDPAYNIFTAALYSDEFRKQHPARILRDYPEKKRVFFVHIPKSAGSDLASHLTSRFPTLNTRLCQKEWATNEEFLHSLKDFMLEAEHSDTIFVTGHNHLALYENWNVLRFEDRIFTVIREPVQQVISQINYVLTRIFSDASPSSPDTRGWRKLFGVEDLSIEHSRDELLKLARRVLLDTGVTGKNIACAYLGGGEYEKSVERIAIHNVEVVDLSTYERWCREEWGITYSRRVNESKKYISKEDLSPSDMDHIMSATDLDRRLHDDLAKALSANSATSVRGEAFARSRTKVFALAMETFVAPISPILEPESKLAVSTLPDVPGLLKQFESLGENCEFGLVQRRCGAEPLGLLRFASAPIHKLLDALRHRFVGLGRADNLEVQLSGNGREYMILDKAFGLLYHAWVSVGEKSPEEILQREIRRVPFLIHKLIEDLSEATKLFVFHGMTPLSRSNALELAIALQTYGPNTLLWTELADEAHPAGTVEQIVPGLIKGFMDRFAPGEDAHDLSLDCWVKLCRATLSLKQATS